MITLNDAQRAILERAEARRPAVPTQRARAAAQGLTFGAADEIEARARSITTGRPYEEVLAEIRGGLEAYRQDQPISSMGYEMGGAALPALLAAPFTGGTSVPLTLGRMLGIGAMQGGAYAFGTGEGGVGERLSRVPGGAVGGAVGGAIGGAATRAAGGALKVKLAAIALFGRDD